MTKEIRLLYVSIIAIMLLFLLAEKNNAYSLGLAQGKLHKMEEFKNTFIPNPANVFPDAILDTTGGL
jgi:hypothetical protein